MKLVLDNVNKYTGSGMAVVSVKVLVCHHRLGHETSQDFDTL